MWASFTGFADHFRDPERKPLDEKDTCSLLWRYGGRYRQSQEAQRRRVLTVDRPLDVWLPPRPGKGDSKIF